MTAPRLTLPALLAFAGWLVACAPAPGAAGWTDQDVAADASDDAGSGQDAGQGTAATDMTGTWLVIHESSVCASILNTVEEQLSQTWILLEIEQQGRFTRETRRMCELHLSPILGLQPRVPIETVRAIRYPEIDLGVVNRVGLGGSWASALSLQTWGIALDDWIRDPVPTRADDPAVRDDDQDGNPGLTVLIGSSCRRFQILREASRYRGTFVDANQIDGVATTSSETRVIGASSGICRTDADVRANDRYNVFRMVRIDGRGTARDLDLDRDGTITCAEAMTIRDDVWTPTAPDVARCLDVP